MNWIKSLAATTTAVGIGILLMKAIAYYPEKTAILCGVVGFIGLVMWFKLLVFDSVSPDDD